MGVRVKVKGDFKYLERYLTDLQKFDPNALLRQYGERGVRELSAATPVYTGRASRSWYYEVVKTNDGYELRLCNSDIEHGMNVIFLIRKGHVNFRGGWVPANDFVTPIVERLYDDLVEELERRYR